MKKSNLFLLVLLLTVGLFACKKDKKEEPVTEKPVTVNVSQNEPSLDLGNNVTTKFFVRVVDESGNAVSGAEIKAGNKTKYTDDNGIAVIDNASVKEKLAYVSAKKSGYFLGSRSVIPGAGTNNINITLLEQNIVSIIQSGQQTTVSVSGGASVDFKGDYVDANGNAYTGDVEVAFKHLPALAEETPNQMPGMLYAQNNEGGSGALETYGMIAVELFGSSGQELQLASGSNATIHLPVDPEQLANAPQTIPLWHFDEVAGYWIEEGEATLINGSYVGDVSHFSFWNCDVFFSDATINGTILDINGNPLSNATVNIITPNASTSGTTNFNGTFFTYIPANESITIEIVDQCGGITGTWTGGPFNANTNNAVTVQQSNANPLNVTGQVLDCNNNLVSNGYVEIVIGNQLYFQPLTNGTINLSLSSCNLPGTLTVNAVDANTAQESGVTTVVINTPTTNIGNLVACTAITEYVTYTIDSNPAVLMASNLNCYEYIDTLGGNTPNVAIWSQSNSAYLSLNTAGTALGAYICVDTDPNTPEGGFGIFGGVDYTTNLPNITIDLNSYGPVGTMVDMNFSGTYYDMNGTMHTVSGSAHVIRTN